MLSPEDAQRVRALAGTVADHDGEHPLNEDATLALAGAPASVTHHLRELDGDLIGYAQRNDSHGTAQLFVHPAHRRRGIGGELLAEVRGVGVWAFGNLPAAQGFAAANGLLERRRLLVMQRPLDPPTGQRFDGVRPFTMQDADALLALNAAAFDWHPEQRRFSRADLDARLAEDWFDPDGLLVTSDADGLTGFHWTKRHPDGRGEVYILATAPRAQGTGLGKRLLAAGLEHLAAAGSPSVHLYVEAANARAVQLYERTGFTVVHSDVLYGPDQPSQEQ
ncbi:mycothiol synthase [Micropruina sonneratiae]|uniref:mycothiol synthase n=1 Tax=Micropruina sonneratiae TaxID=2986940 RepID=UPI0022272F17|nr:mycothiol synthase [Micropruina sp. KQZ13P-5]MCW3156653.1 mycothiol synthase [Micropruina sp. KQZ13P-5]